MLGAVPRQLVPDAVRLDCGCGFAVEGGEDEVVEVARDHALRMHGIRLADGIVRPLTRPLRGGALRSLDPQQGRTEG